MELSVIFDIHESILLALSLSLFLFFYICNKDWTYLSSVEGGGQKEKKTVFL